MSALNQHSGDHLSVWHWLGLAVIILVVICGGWLLVDFMSLPVPTNADAGDSPKTEALKIDLGKLNDSFRKVVDANKEYDAEVDQILVSKPTRPAEVLKTARSQRDGVINTARADFDKAKIAVDKRMNSVAQDTERERPGGSSQSPSPPVVSTLGSGDFTLAALAISNVVLVVIILLVFKQTRQVSRQASDALDFAAESKSELLGHLRVLKQERPYAGQPVEVRRTEPKPATQAPERPTVWERSDPAPVSDLPEGFEAFARQQPPQSFRPPPPAARKPRTSISDLMDQFSSGRIGYQKLIDEVQALGLKWGSAVAIADQTRVQVTFNTTENRILAIESVSGGRDYFLVVRDDGFWSLDLQLAFNLRGSGGASSAQSGDARLVTRQPGRGRLEANNEIEVTAVGLVEVIA